MKIVRRIPLAMLLLSCIRMFAILYVYSENYVYDKLLVTSTEWWNNPFHVIKLCDKWENYSHPKKNCIINKLNGSFSKAPTALWTYFGRKESINAHTYIILYELSSSAFDENICEFPHFQNTRVLMQDRPC